MRMPWSIIVVLLMGRMAVAAEQMDAETLPLVENGKPACTLVVIQSDGSPWLINRAAEAVTTTVKRWTGVDLPQVRIGQQGGTLPPEPAIVLGTLDGLVRFAPECKAETVPAEFLNQHGFACVPIKRGTGLRFIVTGPTPRSVFNGAVCVRDFRIDGTKTELALRTTPIVRTPQLPGRAVYLLTIWGHEARYTADNWITVFDSFARDGFDRIYFWFSGHFPSKKYPQTFRCKDGPWDSTVESGIPTIEDQRKIIRAAHDRGLKIYLGGALGGWVGTRYLTHEAPVTMKTPPKNAGNPAQWSLCPSIPASRIPYPTDIMPYVLTGFVWREMTWEPLLTREQMLNRVRQRFFGREAEPQLAEDLWSLREILRESAGGKLSPANRAKLASIEDRAAKARASAGPKTAETLDLVNRAVADIRKHTKEKEKE